MPINIMCELWKTPNDNRDCDIELVELTEADLIELAIKKGMEQASWEPDDVYHVELLTMSLQ